MKYTSEMPEADSFPFTCIKVHGIVYNLETMHQAGWEIEINKEMNPYSKGLVDATDVNFWHVTAISPCRNITVLAQFERGGYQDWEVIVPTDHYDNNIATSKLYDILLSRSIPKKRAKVFTFEKLVTEWREQHAKTA